MLELRQANIVIIAHSHNPSIVSPDWICKVLGIGETAINFLNTPAFSSFESDSFSLTVDQDRWQLTLKRLTESRIAECIGAAGRYVTVLEHIPYAALGMNFVWKYSPSVSSKGLPKLEVRIGDLDPKTVFSEQQLVYGATLVIDFQSHLLRINMAYDGGTAIVLSENFHFDVSAQDASGIAKIIGSLAVLRAKSEEYARRLMQEG